MINSIAFPECLTDDAKACFKPASGKLLISLKPYNL